MINNLKHNNEKELGKPFKKLSAIALASLLASGGINANEIKTLEQELKTVSKNTYPAFINVYGVGKRFEGNSYSGVGIKIHNGTIEGSLEVGPNFQKASIIGVKKNGNPYMKVGIGYLNLENYKVGKYTINPKQITGGLAIGYNKGNNFNIEAGYIAHRLEGAKKANTTAYTKYLELIYRTQTNIGQFDLTGILKQEEAYNQSDNYTNGSVAYYPTKNFKAQVSYNNLGRYTKNNYNIQAGFKYIFGGGKKGKWSPFISGTYYNNSNIATTIAYEENIANRPLYWKDEFETAINTRQLVAEKVAPEEFRKRVEESFNKAPIISTINGPTTINRGETATYKVVASDPDGDSLSYTWKLDGKIISNKAEASITFDEIKTYTLEVIVSDGKKTTTKTIKINSQNNIPIISAINGPTNVHVGETASYSVNASDKDNQKLSYTWYVNGQKISNNKTLLYTFNSLGEYEIKVVVSDGLASTEKVLKINSVNQAPEIISITGNTTISIKDTLDLTVNYNDPDNDPVNIKWYLNNKEIGVGKNLKYNFTEKGNFNIKVIVDDGISQTEKIIPIKVINLPPTVDAGNNRTVYTGTTVTLTGTASDPDGSIVKVAWYDENGNKISNTNTASVRINTTGDHVFKFVAIDDNGVKAEDTVTIRGIVYIPPNQAPSISISASATTITEGESVTLTANASDPDGSITSIVWYDSNGNQIGTGNSITITPNSTGTFSYYAVATDNDGASKQSNTITINVEEVTYNASWQTPLQSEVNNVGVEPGVISDASGRQVVINDLTSYTANLPDGSTFQIVSAVTTGGDETRMTGFSIEGNSLIRDGPNTGGSRTYGTLTIQIIYPDGSEGPTATLDVEIANS